MRGIEKSIRDTLLNEKLIDVASVIRSSKDTVPHLDLVDSEPMDLKDVVNSKPVEHTGSPHQSNTNMDLSLNFRQDIKGDVSVKER